MLEPTLATAKKKIPKEREGRWEVVQSEGLEGALSHTQKLHGSLHPKLAVGFSKETELVSVLRQTATIIADDAG